MRLETNHIEVYQHDRPIPEMHMGKYSIQGGRDPGKYWVADCTGATLHRVPVPLDRAQRLVRIGNTDGHEAAFKFQEAIRQLVESETR